MLDRNSIPLAWSDPETNTRRYRSVATYLHSVGAVYAGGSKVGIESAADPILQGRANASLWARLWPGRARGRPADVRLTLDAELQELAQRALGKRQGAIVVVMPMPGSNFFAVCAIFATVLDSQDLYPF